MDLKQLRSLVTIAETGSFAAAAEAVGLTQSAVSLHIKHLEEDLGALLFDRDSRPPRLNARGLALLDHARQVVAMCDQIASDAKSGTLKGTLSFGAVPTSLATRLAPALVAMRSDWPDLKIRVAGGSSAELAARVRSAELDAALVSEPTEPLDDLTVHPVSSDPLYVIAPEAAEGGSDKALLESLPYIQFNRRAWAGLLIHKHLTARKIRTDLMMEIDQLEAIREMVRNGLGVSIVPLSGPPAGPTPGLRLVPFGDPPVHRNLVVIERRPARRAPLVEALTEALRAAVPVTESGI